MSVKTVSGRTSLMSTTVVLFSVCYAHQASASECYDHYNADAWGGDGLAIVFCRNNSDSSKDSYITDCELREHNGAKLQDLERHGALDNDRLVYTDYDTTGDAFDFDIDVVGDIATDASASGGTAGSGGASEDAGLVPTRPAEESADGCACSAPGSRSQVPFFGLLGLFALFIARASRLRSRNPT